MHCLSAVLAATLVIPVLALAAPPVNVALLLIIPSGGRAATEQGALHLPFVFAFAFAFPGAEHRGKWRAQLFGHVRFGTGSGS